MIAVAAAHIMGNDCAQFRSGHFDNKKGEYKMTILKAIATVGVSAAMIFGATGAALAKGHDNGKADGSRTDPSTLRGGVVASNDVAGVGRDAEGNFLGVADANHDLTYGQDVVALQRATDTRRVKPCGVGNKPACE